MERAKINKKKLWLVLSIIWVLGWTLLYFPADAVFHWMEEARRHEVAVQEAADNPDCISGWDLQDYQKSAEDDALLALMDFDAEVALKEYQDVCDENGNCRLGLQSLRDLRNRLSLKKDLDYADQTGRTKFLKCNPTDPGSFWQSFDTRHLYSWILFAVLGPFLMGVVPPLLIRLKRWITT